MPRQLNAAASTGHWNRRFPDDWEAALAAEYRAGASATALALKHGVSITLVRGALDRQGVARRNATDRQRRYRLNEAAFDDAARSEEAAYWIGFLFADGCVHEWRWSPTVSVAVAADDGPHLEALRVFLGTNHPLYLEPPPKRFPHRSPKTVLSVSSRRLADALARHGVVPRKSLTATPSAAMAASRHFWRGAVDGDGWVGVTRRSDGWPHPSIGLTGSQPACKALRQFLAANVGKAPAVGKNGDGHCWRVRLGGEAAYDLTRLLYENCTIALPRKHTGATEILSRFAGHVWRRGLPRTKR